MLVRATRTASALTLRALFYCALFLFVVIAHLAITGALRELGWNGGAALTASGAIVLALVLLLVNIADWIRAWVQERREMQRVRLRLPPGPCCVVWRTSEAPEAEESEDGMPWEPAGPIRARYPRSARRLGVEGMAIVEFEVSANGRAKNINCVDAWPSDVFYTAAREALTLARFQPKYDVHVRFGASYKMPFVFRIEGSTRLKERGRRARLYNPALHAAGEAVKKLRRRA
ncbi:MAG: energy transducer TonB [Phycisphaerales bacterium]|nr:energy transducer TonB [Hyphomonadaceae bacterium]